MTKVGLLLRRAGIILVVCTATTIAASAQAFTTLFSFDYYTDGGYPTARLIQATDGNFYGTTSDNFYDCFVNHNNEGCGTVFKITPGGTLTTLYKFCAQANCSDGATPYAGLMQATDGNLYGTTMAGGTGAGCGGDGCGTVFKITPTGTLTTLYNFCAQAHCTDGAEPSAELIQATDGDFYGTTIAGGASSNCPSAGCGTVFKITPGGTLTTLHNFNGADGSGPFSRLVQATDGDFYGTFEGGGTYGGGTVFKITLGGTLTTLYNFCQVIPCPDGYRPYGGLMQATDGNFYGTTVGYGSTYGYGTVFKITPVGMLTTLYSFKLTEGHGPFGGLIQATDGNFYGTTAQGPGKHGHGTVFEITPGGTLGTLYTFCAQTNCTDGDYPSGGLVQATDGNLYGTTVVGGAGGACWNGCGTVFRLAVVPAVTLTKSVSFGNQVLNQTSAAKTVTLKMSGTALPIITGVTLEGSSFAISANTCNGATVACKVNVTFTPAALGKLTGTLTFTDNASNSPQTVPLSGIGVEPATLPPSALFGTWSVGSTSTAKTFTLTNYQSVDLTSIAISTTGDFAVSATTCTTSLAAKSKCTISVTFTPTVLGTRTGQLSVSDSASNTPQTSALTGTGVEPATLVPLSASFGTWAVGSTSTAKTFTLTNYQSVALTSIALSTTGDFAVSATTCTTSLAAQSKCTISVTFTPTVLGTRKGQLSVTDSASNTPQTSHLSGTGQ